MVPSANLACLLVYVSGIPLLVIALGVSGVPPNLGGVVQVVSKRKATQVSWHFLVEGEQSTIAAIAN